MSEATQAAKMAETIALGKPTFSHNSGVPSWDNKGYSTSKGGEDVTVMFTLRALLRECGCRCSPAENQEERRVEKGRERCVRANGRVWR